MTDKKTIFTTTTTTCTEVEPATEQSLDVLTPQEEKVLRMIHGLSEPGTHVLKFGLGASEETRLQLAALEMFLVQNMRGPKAVAQASSPLLNERLDALFSEEA